VYGFASTLLNIALFAGFVSEGAVRACPQAITLILMFTHGVQVGTNECLPGAGHVPCAPSHCHSHALMNRSMPRRWTLTPLHSSTIAVQAALQSREAYVHEAAAGLDEEGYGAFIASATLRTQQGTMLSVPVALLLVQAAPGGALSSWSGLAIAVAVAGSLPFAQVRGAPKKFLMVLNHIIHSVCPCPKPRAHLHQGALVVCLPELCPLQLWGGFRNRACCCGLGGSPSNGSIVRNAHVSAE